MDGILLFQDLATCDPYFILPVASGISFCYLALSGGYPRTSITISKSHLLISIVFSVLWLSNLPSGILCFLAYQHIFTTSVMLHSLIHAHDAVTNQVGDSGKQYGKTKPF